MMTIITLGGGGGGCGNFHVNELPKLISLLFVTQNLIFQLKIALQRRSLLYIMGLALQRNKFMQLIYMKIPPIVLRALNVQDA